MGGCGPSLPMELSTELKKLMMGMKLVSLWVQYYRQWFVGSRCGGIILSIYRNESFLDEEEKKQWLVNE